jgi:uncharacterized protein YeaO (DUF488 family)
VTLKFRPSYKTHHKTEKLKSKTSSSPAAFSQEKIRVTGKTWLSGEGMIKTKRIYESPAEEDGFRILVDRLWPRGVQKEKAKIDLWLKEIAPSDELRKWFSHDPEKWEEFKKKYAKELATKQELLNEIRQTEKEKGTVTLLYSARDTEHNNAVALKIILEKK